MSFKLSSNQANISIRILIAAFAIILLSSCRKDDQNTSTKPLPKLEKIQLKMDPGLPGDPVTYYFIYDNEKLKKIDVEKNQRFTALEYFYDNSGKLTQIKEYLEEFPDIPAITTVEYADNKVSKASGGWGNFSRTFTYDPNGNIVVKENWGYVNMIINPSGNYENIQLSPSLTTPFFDWVKTEHNGNINFASQLFESSVLLSTKSMHYYLLGACPVYAPSLISKNNISTSSQEIYTTVDLSYELYPNRLPKYVHNTYSHQTLTYFYK